jgi:hypothetical protein
MSETKKSEAYRTGLMASDYTDYPEFPYKGRNWYLTLLTPRNPKSFTSSVKGIFPAMEVIIHAPTEIAAQRAADLIHSARLVVTGRDTFL